MEDAEYSRDRPKWGKKRAITARKLKLTFTQIAGYATIFSESAYIAYGPDREGRNRGICGVGDKRARK